MELEERQRLLADIAELYYIRGKTQSDIARNMGFSRSAISRLLTEARQSNIVEIHINYPLDRSYTLESAMRERFGLKDVFVIDRGIMDYHTALRQIGKLAAGYIETNLPETGILGVSWGRTTYEVASAMSSQQKPGCTVVQMLGALGKISQHIDGDEVVRYIAKKMGARFRVLHSPLFIDNPDLRDGLMKEGHVHDILDLALNADIALVGIGSIEPAVSSLHHSGYLSAAQLESLAEAGAVGDIAANHYDIDGNIVEVDLNKRSITVDIGKLKRQKGVVLGVAGGKRKAQPILGALRGGYIQVLVTDSPAAQEVLNLDSGNV